MTAFTTLQGRPSAVSAARAAAACTLAGTLLSGPVALLVVANSRPQPAWTGADTFAAHYHSVQLVPFFCGLLLVGGFLCLIASLHGLASDDLRVRTGTAVAFAAAFGAIVFVNYAVQTTFIPALLASGDRDATALAGHLTMVNPASLGWALEMWGYAVLGVATWLVAPVFRGRRWGRLTSGLFVANGPASVAGALASAAWPGWVLTSLGYWAFGLWNVLVVAMALASLVSLRSGGAGSQNR